MGLLRKIKNYLYNVCAPHSLSREMSDEDFIEIIFLTILERYADERGKNNIINEMRNGKLRHEVVEDLLSSAEYETLFRRHNYVIQEIMSEKPRQYGQSRDLYNHKQNHVFFIKNDEDFDWLEKKIIENNYYERNDSPWDLQAGADVTILAEIINLFEPKAVLELGCSSGYLLKILQDQGVGVKGIDISQKALKYSPEEVKKCIIINDVNEYSYEDSVDLVVAMDLFEHLNPNRIHALLKKIWYGINPGGYVVCNIPAFGSDEIFGEIFPFFMREWVENYTTDDIFKIIKVDKYGYPYNGHLISAGTKWWVNQFERAGFIRDISKGTTIHKLYSESLKKISPARLSLFIFRKND